MYDGHLFSSQLNDPEMKMKSQTILSAEAHVTGQLAACRQLKTGGGKQQQERVLLGRGPLPAAED